MEGLWFHRAVIPFVFYHSARDPDSCRIGRYGFVHKTHRTDHGLFTNLNVLSSQHGAPHTQVSIFSDNDLIMPLFPSMAREINTIRNANIVLYDHVFRANIVEIAFHTDEDILADFESAQPIECYPDWCQHAIRSDVLTYSLTDKVPYFLH